MSRGDAYVSSGGSRSPRSVRLPTVDRSPSRPVYPGGGGGGGGGGGSPLGAGGIPRDRGRPLRPSRSGANSPDPYGPSTASSGLPYHYDDFIGSPMLEEQRGRPLAVGPPPQSSLSHHHHGVVQQQHPQHHRSRSATRPTNPMSVRYQSLDRGGTLIDHDREFLPIRDRRDRSLERSLYFDEDLYGSGARSARQSPTSHQPSFLGELQHQNSDLQRELGTLKKELELTNQKLGSSMHSIKTFWSPELKKERALRKEESAKYSLINDQLKLLSNENQKQAMLVRQLEEELRMRMRGPSIEVQQQMEVIYQENEHLNREIAILRDTIKELELRIETQKQTLQARDESIKKLLEMLQNKGMGKEEERQMFQQMQAMAQKQELRQANDTLRTLQSQLEMVPSPSSSTMRVLLDTKDARIATLEREVGLLEREVDRLGAITPSLLMMGADYGAMAISNPAINSTASHHHHINKRQLDEFRVEIQRRDQEILAMSAKMKTLEEQHQDYQRHIAVLKESLCAKEEHYNMLQADVEEMRQRLEEKNRLIEKKTQQVQQERQRVASENSELREHMDIKDRKINVLQRKMELLEASKKQQNNVGPQKPHEDLGPIKKQLEEQRRQNELQKQQVDEQKKAVDNKHRQVVEKEKQIQEMDQELKRRKEQMDKLEASLQKAGGSAAAAGELNKKLAEAEKNLERAQEEAKRSAAEMERLLQLVQMSQEEQNSKEKTIMELQQALKIAQAKMKQQQQANAQLEEQRKKDEKAELHNKFVTDREEQIEIKKKEIPFVDLESVDEFNNVPRTDGDDASEFCSFDNLNLVKSTKVSDLLTIISDKEKRITELEDAVRESLAITMDREALLQREEHKRKVIMEKLAKLEHRLLSLQSAQAMKCHSCRPVIARINGMETTLSKLLSERKYHMQDLADMKQEALKAAISEKDAHLALLEISGIRSARQAQEADRLLTDRRRLVERLKHENELNVLLKEKDPGSSSIEDLQFEVPKQSSHFEENELQE